MRICLINIVYNLHKANDMISIKKAILERKVKLLREFQYWRELEIHPWDADSLTRQFLSGKPSVAEKKKEHDKEYGRRLDTCPVSYFRNVEIRFPNGACKVDCEVIGQRDRHIKLRVKREDMPLWPSPLLSPMYVSDGMTQYIEVRGDTNGEYIEYVVTKYYNQEHGH